MRHSAPQGIDVRTVFSYSKLEFAAVSRRLWQLGRDLFWGLFEIVEPIQRSSFLWFKFRKNTP